MLETTKIMLSNKLESIEEPFQLIILALTAGLFLRFQESGFFVFMKSDAVTVSLCAVLVLGWIALSLTLYEIIKYTFIGLSITAVFLYVLVATYFKSRNRKRKSKLANGEVR